MEENKSYLSIGADNAATLLKTQRWTNFLSILGFIGSGFLFLMGIAYGVGAVLTELMPGIIAAIISILYVGLAAVSTYICLNLSRASHALQAALATGDNAKLDEAVKYQYGYWKANGILSIVTIVLMLLLFIGMIIAISMVPSLLS